MSTTEPKTPMFIIGADDRPADTRTVAIALTLRAEIKVGDREFSSPVHAHEVVVLRHFYEARAGSGQVRVYAAWPPGLNRDKSLTHSDLAAEAKRMRDSFITVRQGGQVVRSFDTFFGTEPTEQLKRLHAVMREQREAWNALYAKALKRIEGDTADLHPEMRKSMAYDLITEREVEEILLIADPARRGLNEFVLDEIKEADLTLTGDAAINQALTPKPSLDEIKANAEKQADDESSTTLGERVADLLGAAGVESTKALAVGTLWDQHAGQVSDDDLARVLGSKAKADQARKIIAKG